MKVLVEIRQEDTVDTDFASCENCAFAKAVKRILIPNVQVSESTCDISLQINRKMVYVQHALFRIRDFKKLNRLPQGSFMIYEMDIPEEFLNETWLNKHPQLRVNLKQEVSPNG